MYLVNNPLSPFAARVRIQIYAKNLPVELKLLPRDELKSSAYLALNPMGKVPCLVDGDDAIPESGTIVSYLEELFPQPSMKGATPRENAQIRLIEDVAMLGIWPAMSKLFGQMSKKTRNEQAAADALAELLGDPALRGRITLSSDGQASLPNFDAEGRLIDCGVADIGSLLDTLRALQRAGRLDFGLALEAATRTPAQVWGLARKGGIAAGMDADLLLVEPDGLRLRATIAGGRLYRFDEPSLAAAA